MKNMKLAALELDNFNSFGEWIEADCTFVSFSEDDVTEWEMLHLSDQLLIPIIHIIWVAESSFSAQYTNSYNKQNYGTYNNKNTETDHGAEDDENDPCGVNEHALRKAVLSLVSFFLKYCFV